MELDAIVFDKDGTLVDFEATFCPATVRVLGELSGGDRSLMQQLADALDFDLTLEKAMPGSLIVAGSGLDFAQALQPVLGFPDQEAFAVEIDQMYGRICRDTVRPLPGIAETLPRLKASGLILGVATNDAEENARSQMEQLGFDRYLTHTLGADSGYGPKPGPGMVSGFVSLTGCDPKRVLMVGDSLHDLEAGRAAGVLTCAVDTGPATLEEIAGHADLAIASVVELPASLGLSV